MKEEAILDQALKELCAYNEKNLLSARPEHLLKQYHDLTRFDRYLIMKKITNDGYASESSLAKDEYWITWLGKMCIKKNGYTGISRKKWWERSEKFLWLILGVALSNFQTILYATTSIFQSFFQFLRHL